MDHFGWYQTKGAHTRCVVTSDEYYHRKNQGENLNFKVGDLVTNRLGGDLGLVVKIDKANSSSLKKSVHSISLLDNSPDIYYVFFPDGSTAGPYYTSELLLKNGTDGTTIR